MTMSLSRVLATISLEVTLIIGLTRLCILLYVLRTIAKNSPGPATYTLIYLTVVLLSQTMFLRIAKSLDVDIVWSLIFLLFDSIFQRRSSVPYA